VSAVGRRERARKRERHRRLTRVVEPEAPAEPKRVGVLSPGARTRVGEYRMPDPSAWLRERVNRIRGL
jgi:hypothetical protein